MKLSIVIPAYNEESRLPKTLDDYMEFFEGKLGDDLELIVVVNNCSDDTEGVARAAAEMYPQINVIVETTRIRKGGAVWMGMRMSKGELVGFVDADGSTPPKMFSQLMGNIGNSGCIIGSRWVEGAIVNPQQSWFRRVASRILNLVIVHSLFGLDVRDSQCGAKLFRREVLDKVLPEFSESGWAFDIELLCRVKRLGYGIREYPIEWHHVSGNPINFMLMSMQMLASVWRVKRVLARM
ncbi:glycosyltransferase family 2 protein [Pontiellaceae bacterium B12219]|nr:glycosyltransferase family 2 protein [Pontiellaceae bacterium B12219]